MTQSGTASSQETRISGDSHVSEPPDLWERNLPAKFRDRPLRFTNVQIGVHNHARPGGWDPVERLKDMAYDGISAEVLYPSLAGRIFHQFYEHPVDVEWAQACERVYNDWMIDFCQESPERLWGQAFISLWDIEHAIGEMTRCKRAGLAGVTIWVAPPEEIPFTGDHYERFWSAATDLEMPIGMHINTGFGAYVSRQGEGNFGRLVRQAFGHKAVAMKATTELILSGVLERHPNLKVVLAEFEVGWIPFFLEDLDRKMGRGRGLGLSLMPSEYFARQVYATFMQDGVGGYLLNRWGTDNFVFANDYPHAGGIWPYSDDSIELMLGGLSGETRRKVLGETLAKIYARPMPTPILRQTSTDYKDDIWSRPWLKKASDFSFDKATMGLQ